MRERERILRTQGFMRVAGVDEAGRGPLAGPVVASVAVLHDDAAADAHPPFDWLAEVFDSKQVSPEDRERLYGLITAADSPFHVGTGMRSHEEIDRINILRATHESMRDAIANLVFPPDYVLVDGTEIPRLGLPQEKVIKGDSLCLCIAAASIVAKVTRDRIMIRLAADYPQYGFDTHKGYGTPDHIEALRRHGRSPVHRRSFKVAKIDAPELWDDDDRGGR
jgi:ribonuclease HII